MTLVLRVSSDRGVSLGTTVESTSAVAESRLAAASQLCDQAHGFSIGVHDSACS